MKTYYIWILILILCISSVAAYTGKGFVFYDTFNWSYPNENFQDRGWYYECAGVPLSTTAGAYEGWYVDNCTSGNSELRTNATLTNITRTDLNDFESIIIEFDYVPAGHYSWYVYGNEDTNAITRIIGNGYATLPPYRIAIWDNNPVQYIVCDKFLYPLTKYNIKIILNGTTNITSMKINDALQNCTNDFDYNMTTFSDLRIYPQNETLIDNYYIYLANSSIVYNNEIPVIETWGYDTGSPTCVGSQVNYMIPTFGWTDTENDNARMLLDCGDGNIIGTDYSYFPPSYYQSIYCTYNEVGDYTAVLYIQDMKHSSDYSSNVSRTFSVTDSEICYNTGVGGNLNISTTGGGVGFGDWTEGISSSLNTMGVISTSTRFFFVLILIIIFDGYLIIATMKNGSTITGGIGLVILFVDILMILGAVVIGLLPVWILFLIFMLAAGVGWVIIRAVTTGE